MVLSDLLQILIFGIVNGSIIAVGAVGLTLSYGVTRFINFAYGEFLTYGAFTAVILTGIAGFEIGLPLGIIVAVGMVGFLGVITARVFYEPLSGKPVALLITSIGVSLILRNMLRIGVGTQGKNYPIPLMRSWSYGGLQLHPTSALLLVVAVIVMFGIHLMLKYTMLGKKMRATSGNTRLAIVSGIDTTRVVRKTWFISAAIGALAGILLGLQFPPIRPIMGWNFLIVVFAATILGGIGKPYGAMVGSLIVGIAMSLGTFYISSEYRIAYAFLILVVVLLVKPEGIAGGEL